MPVTGLYYISENTTRVLQHLQDRLLKRYQPPSASRWQLEHRLLREVSPPTPPTPITGSPSTTAATTSPPTAAPATTTTTTTAPAQPRFMQYLELSHHPARLFVLCGDALITVERDFATLVRSKMGGMWTYRQTLRAEGLEYAVEDFRVRMGRVQLGDQAKGVIIEVEFISTGDMKVGEGIVRDFLEGLEVPRGKWVFDREGRPEGDWKVTDTGRQYCDLLKFR